MVYFVVIWYIFPRFGILCQYKSGNPAAEQKKLLTVTNGFEANCAAEQGDQIGRIFARWEIF
jgi:hypothetical protein